MKIIDKIGLFLMLSTPAMAQQAGDIITGQVVDEFGPVMMANVVEIDAAGRIVVAKTTDMNGNFSFALKNPKDRLRVSYVGYDTQTLPIKGTTFNITMSSKTMLQEVKVKGTSKAQGSGLAIPTKEISTSRQTISTKEFEGLSVTTIDEALQGRIAGLDIVANSGNLGSGTSMRLRGVSSINGSSEPLVVVDGNVWEIGDMDLSGANDEKFAELLNINPEDIESISVLKDAAATAIWGSQGANGVIEIKTKRGARGKTQVTYSFRLTGTYQPNGMKMLDGDQYTMMLKEEYFNRSFKDDSNNFPEINYIPTFTEYEMYNNNTDWVKSVQQTGWRQNHYVSLSGGGERANFRISAGYDTESGSIIKQNLNRFTSRVALDYFINNRIKVSTNVAFTYTDNDKNYSDLLGVAYNRMPNLSIYEQDQKGNNLDRFYNILPSMSEQLKGGQYETADQNKAPIYNPVALAHLAKNNEQSYNIEPEFKINYELLGISEGKSRLTYEGKIVFNIFNKYNDMYLPLELSPKGWYEGKDANKVNNDSQKSLGITHTHTLTFVPHFKNEDHSLMAMLRYQMTSGNNTSQNTSLWGLPSGTINSVGAPGVITNLSTGNGQWRSIYLTFSAHYAFKGRYIVDFSLRRDGNTKFGPDQRWGTFPAVSGKWIISDEPWMKKTEKWLSMLAFRPGWGIVGNAPGQEGLYYSQYGGGGGYLGTGSNFPTNIQLKNIRWEQKETWNFGLDFAFLNNRIDGNVEIYTQKTSDLLMANRGIPTSSGYSSLSWQNVGSMRNSGWEFNLNGNGIVRAGKFSIDMNVTFANNSNKILEMDETCLRTLNDEFNRNNGQFLRRTEIDRPFGAIYGFRYKGVYQYSEYSVEEVKGVSGPNAPVARDANGNVILDNKGYTIPMAFCYENGQPRYEFRGGDAIYEDINYDGQINELDIVYLGSSLPKITGGWGIKFKYGNWTLNSQFNFRMGNKIVNVARMNAENMYSNNNQSAAVNWRWRVEGDVTQIPRALYQKGYNWLGSDRFVEDGSFMRLNYMQLSYAVPQKTIRKWGLSQLSFYISANNLFCITKYSGADPEIGIGGIGYAADYSKTPRSKSFTGGVTVSF
ncbi:MAG: SusC/RagA family TonB-linked outer membrane protein [Prevotella sp.]|nr:SusC/RagA family TonB-linked outer membrane protein [Candidatus Prevotella equi]